MLSLFYPDQKQKESSQHFQHCDDCYLWNYTRGIYYGYPPCCIESFSAQLAGVKPSAVQLVVAKNRFIPCRMHALQITAGDIKIEDLIHKYRAAPESFIECTGYSASVK